MNCRTPAASCSGPRRARRSCIVRGKDMQIRAFYNTCRHRGAPLVKTDVGPLRWPRLLVSRLDVRPRRQAGEPARQARLRRPRHGAHSLVSVRCEQFGNWVFVNEDPNAQPLLEDLAPIPAVTSSSSSPSAALRREARLRPQVQREGAARRVPRDLSPEVDSPEHGGPLPRSPRHLSIALYRHGHSLMVTPNRRPDWVDPGTDRHAPRRDRDSHLGRRTIRRGTSTRTWSRRSIRPAARSWCSGRPARTRCASNATGSRPTGAAVN